ncbi:MAG TPA: sigma-70 family RNA polymerase sigma factor [Chthoniobacterales bacterium]|nr:sigma-70 family RNA polymerase sigma factor [Chthoniobacterales bacterium]
MHIPAATRAEFERLLQEHGGIIYKVAYGYARGESDRRDLMQEIALQLWRAFPHYTPGRPFSTWMYRIALNVSISFLRKQRRTDHNTVELDEAQHEPMQESSNTPEMEERIALLHQIIAKSAPLDRALLLLYLDDCSYREIASVLGLTETNVATKLSRLKERIRQELTTKHDQQ